MKIQQLMRIPRQKRDLDWLKMSLQSTIELEHATIPPYLCAGWSIMETDSKKHPGNIRKWILDIAKQEMLHMGLACNLLTAIGGTPNIYCAGFVPKYPGPLPGHVRPGLVVGLAGLAKDDAADLVKKKEVIQTFMQIEYPEQGPLALAAVAADTEEYPTIGAFYDAIYRVFAELQPALSLHHQMTLPGFGLKPIAVLQDAHDAIQLIKVQGEGTSQSPLQGDGTVMDDDHLAHYYKFASIYYEKKITKDPAAPHGWSYSGDPLPFPTADQLFLMAEVPPGGYAEAEEVDKLYTAVLKDLHYAWEAGDSGRLRSAITDMGKLEAAAIELLKRKLPAPAGKGIKGPSFVFRP